MNTILNPLDMRIHMEQLWHNGVRFLVATIHEDDYIPGMGLEVERVLRSRFQIVYRQRDQLCLMRDDYVPSTEYVRVKDLT